MPNNPTPVKLINMKDNGGNNPQGSGKTGKLSSFELSSNNNTVSIGRLYNNGVGISKSLSVSYYVNYISISQSNNLQDYNTLNKNIYIKGTDGLYADVITLKDASRFFEFNNLTSYIIPLPF